MIHPKLLGDTEAWRPWRRFAAEDETAWRKVGETMEICRRELLYRQNGRKNEMKVNYRFGMDFDGNDDWRVLHDAATGELPEIPFAAGFFTRAALVTVAGNYEQCALWRERLIGWQQWYEAIASSIQ